MSTSDTMASAMGVARVYAMLRIDEGELLPDIIDRLDAAVAKAVIAPNPISLATNGP